VHYTSKGNRADISVRICYFKNMHKGAATNSDPGGLQFHKNNHFSKYSGGISRKANGRL
jgi:hypothetical protein